MNELSLWKKKEFNGIRKEIDELFDLFYKDFSTPFEIIIQEPIFAIDDMEKDLVVRTRLKNASFLEMHLSIFEDRIILTGVGRKENQAFFSEFDQKCVFKKTLKLPCKIKSDEAQATYKDGILNINLPKKHVGEEKKVVIRII